jgi:hypothetical protein
MLAQARWQPGSVVLVTPQGSRRFADLDALTREVLGESVPIEAWFDWLHGRPWPGAASTPQTAGTGFRQLGWTVDLSRFPPAPSRPRGSNRSRRSACGSSSTAREGSDMSLPALHDVPAPAKLNLFLHVVGRRDDGYHLIDSLMLPIDWCDTLHFERRATAASPATTSATRFLPTTCACAPPGPCSRRPARRWAPTSRSRSACPPAPASAAAAPTPPRPCSP